MADDSGLGGLAQRRPAELTAALVGSAAGLATGVVGNDPAQALVTALVGLVPAVVSQLVDLRRPAGGDGGSTAQASGPTAQASGAVRVQPPERVVALAALEAVRKARAAPDPAASLEVLRVMIGAPPAGGGTPPADPAAPGAQGDPSATPPAGRGPGAGQPTAEQRP